MTCLVDHFCILQLILDGLGTLMCMRECNVGRTHAQNNGLRRQNSRAEMEKMLRFKPQDDTCTRPHDVDTGVEVDKDKHCTEYRNKLGGLNSEKLHLVEAQFSRVNCNLRQMKDSLDRFLLDADSRKNSHQITMNIAQQWRAVGKVLDRLFFILYICAIAMSLLFMFPRPSHMQW